MRSAMCTSIAAATVLLVSAQTPAPLSRAEQTRFEETSRESDVRSLLTALADRTSRLRLESFGRTEEGRDLMLAVVGDPPAASAEAARASGRPVVFVMANIHAGEVEGKEAVLHLARRLTIGDLQELLQQAVWLFAPNYNADGNEKISLNNRSEQYGPIGGVGTRENERGLDLNRDFVKLESVEGRALAALFTRWDPAVIVDLHTTDGSYHGYHLTYAPALNPNTDSRLIAFTRERLLPTVTTAMASKHRFRTYYYGNFATAEAMDRELNAFAPNERGTRAWRTFDSRPRFGNNYAGLRNRISILSEAYSYLDFAGRVRVTEAFVEEIMRFVGANATEVRSIVAAVDADTARIDPTREAGVAFALRALPTPVDILVGAVEAVLNPRSGRPMTRMVENVATPTRMSDYGVFSATRLRRVPRSYVLAASTSGLHERVAAKLREHGIRIDSLDAAATMSVEAFVLDTVTRTERPFQGHQEVSVTGRYERRDISVPAASIVVRTDQPLGRLVFYLLEPESDDSLATWNLLDDALKPGMAHPVMKVF